MALMDPEKYDEIHTYMYNGQEHVTLEWCVDNFLSQYMLIRNHFSLHKLENKMLSDQMENLFLDYTNSKLGDFIVNGEQGESLISTEMYKVLFDAFTRDADTIVLPTRTLGK